MVSAPPPPSIVSAPLPPMMMLAAVEPRIDTPVDTVLALTLTKFATCVESLVVWSEADRSTSADARRTSVLLPVPPSIETSVPV